MRGDGAQRGLGERLRTWEEDIVHLGVRYGGRCETFGGDDGCLPSGP